MKKYILTTALATALVSPAYAGTVWMVSPNPVIAAMYAGTYTGPGSLGNWIGTPFDKLAPNQQAWANQQRNVWAQLDAGGAADYQYWSAGGRNPNGVVDTLQYLSQLSLMPDAVWPFLQSILGGPIDDGIAYTGETPFTGLGGYVVTGIDNDPVGSPVPEPSTWAMGIAGFAFLAGMGWRSKRKRKLVTA